MLLHETLRTTTMLSDGTAVKIEIKNIDFMPPFGDEFGGRVTADVTATVLVLELEIAATRSFDRRVYDGEPDDDFVRENDWQDWYGDEEMIDHPLRLEFERRLSSAVSRAIGGLEQLREGCLSEEDIEKALSKRDLVARLVADFSDCRRWRLDVTKQQDDAFWTDEHRFASLQQVAKFISGYVGVRH